MTIANADPNYPALVRMLRTYTPTMRIAALHASEFWSEERLQQAEAQAEREANGDDAAPAKPAAILKLVTNGE